MIALALLLAASARAERPAYTPARLAALRGVTETRIAPDGRSAAFVSDITGAFEAWTVPARGGWPMQVSWLRQQVSDLHYSPDGKRFAFTSDFGGDERPHLYLADVEGGEPEDLSVAISSRQAEGAPRFSPNGRRLAFTSDPDQPFLWQLFTLDLSSRKRVQLTRESVGVRFPVWSPDGRTIAVVRSGDDQKGELMLVPADGSGEEPRVIDPPVAGGIMIPQQFSADGRELLCMSRNAKGFLQLYLLEASSGRGRFIGQDGWDVDQAVYHPIAGILYTRNEGGASALYRLPNPDDKPMQVLEANGRIEDFDVDDAGDKLVYEWSDSQHASDAWLLDLRTGVRERLTRSMAVGVHAERLSKAKLIQYPSFDGRKVTALYLPPAVKRLGEPPPLVVEVHGGPDWQTYDDFSAGRQALAEAGFAVLAPNFRGSTGYGREWLELNRKDWGGADRRDLIEGVRFLAKQGSVDAKRVGITGESYGGYMTLYALARNDGTWAAGVERYGMPDLALDYDLSKERFADWYLTQMGSPEVDAKLYKERSAISYLDELGAPLLIFQGERDTNVPKAESELVYKRLKDKGRDVELVVYPDEGHGFTRREHLVDYYGRLVGFFSRTLAPR